MTLEGKAAGIRDRILDRVRSGLYAPGCRMPNDRDLSRDLCVSRATLGKALRQLQQEGILTRRVGCGTFVTGSAGERVSGTRLQTIGLVSRMANTPWAMQALEGMHEALDALHCDIVWKTSNGDPDTKKGLVQSLAKREADAFVVFTAYPYYSSEGAAFYEELSRRVPVILTDSVLYANVTCVTPDAIDAGRLAAECLLEKAPSNGTFWVLRSEFMNSSFHERVLGYVDRLRAAGVGQVLELTCGPGSEDQRATQIAGFLDQHGLPDGMFLLKDDWPKLLQAALKGRRKRLQDLNVCCSDNWSNAPSIYGVPYVELPFVDTGREIARRLLRMKMEPALPPLSIRLKPRLIREPALDRA